MNKTTSIRVYTVVEVWRGLAAAVTTFTDLTEARRYLGAARCKGNALEDEVRLFEGTVALRLGATAAGRRLPRRLPRGPLAGRRN